MKRAFAIAAHPDDIEFFMAGTLMMLGEAGYEIHYMNVANGCCGTTQFDAPTIARLRLEEAVRLVSVEAAERLAHFDAAGEARVDRRVVVQLGDLVAVA